MKRFKILSTILSLYADFSLQLLIISHSTNIGKHFSVDFESMDHLTWNLMNKICVKYMEPAEDNANAKKALIHINMLK